jgi:hypothetical protein
VHAVLVSEEAQNLAIWTGGAGREQSRPAVFRQLLAYSLIVVPAAAIRGGWAEPDCRELFVRGEVGDLDIDLPPPQLARHLREGWNHALGR